MPTEYAIIRDLGELGDDQLLRFLRHPATRIKVEHDGRILHEFNPTKENISYARAARMGEEKRMAMNLDTTVPAKQPSEEEVERRLDEIKGEMEGEAAFKDVEEGDDEEADEEDDGYETDGKMTFTMDEGPSGGESA